MKTPRLERANSLDEIRIGWADRSDVGRESVVVGQLQQPEQHGLRPRRSGARQSPGARGSSGATGSGERHERRGRRSPNEQELAGRAFSGFFWSYGGVFSGRILFFAATLVLARVLTPAQFGLVAFVIAILAYLDNLADLGVGQALVYRADGRNDDVASTAFWVGIGGSIVAIALVCAAAPFLGRVGPAGASSGSSWP